MPVDLALSSRFSSAELTDSYWASTYCQPLELLSLIFVVQGNVLVVVCGVGNDGDFFWMFRFLIILESALMGSNTLHVGLGNECEEKVGCSLGMMGF